MARAELVSLVERAATPSERLSSGFLPAEGQEDERLVERRLAAWSKAAAQGDADLFARRLAWDGLDMAAARRAVSPVRLVEDAPLPAWAGIVAEAISQQAAPAGDRSIQAGSPVPFEEILSRFVLVARRQLDGVPGHSLLSETAHADLERSLLLQLSDEAAQALFFEFAILRFRQQSPAASSRRPAPDTSGRSIYRQFVARLEGRGLLNLFATYPVLARVLGTITQLWVEAQMEFLARLLGDSTAIAGLFAPDGALGQVVGVATGLSDPHRGRRMVQVLTFAPGLQLVYKPKSLAMDVAFSRIVAWLVEAGAPYSFRRPLTLERETHGWVEFIQQRDCGDETQMRRYFQHAGALLALVHVLVGTDCHAENIIAQGDQPVLIDLEMLAQPHIRQGSPSGAANALVDVWLQQENSILRTQMLPRWVVGFGGMDVADVGGLGRGDEPARQALRWLDGNTDHMRRDHVPLEAGGARGPRLAGRPVDSAGYIDDLVAGFRRMYCFLLERREALLALDSPLHHLSAMPVRVVYRPTMVCIRLLNQLRQPKYLGDGADWGIGMELLARLASWYESMGAPETRPLYWPTLAVEQRALAQGDVPFFTASTGGTVMHLGDGREIPDAFAEPGFSLVLERISGLCSDDMERQVGLIRASFLSYQPTRPPALPDVMPAGDGHEPPSKTSLLALATAIGEDLKARAIYDPGGNVGWIAPQMLGRLSVIVLLPLGPDLHSGAAGPALFLAALSAVTGDSGYRGLALAAARSLCYAPTVRLPLGAAEGLGSIVYALAQMASLLGEPDLSLEARRIAALITPERIAADTLFDVTAGSAGALLGLLALDPPLRDPGIRETARLLGEHLLAHRLAGPRGGRAWPSMHGRLLGGFAHGAAGIAYALQRLYAATRDARLLRAAQEALAYEATIFTPERGDWLDLRMDEQPAYFSAWCNGAPGIGLARLGGLRIVDGETAREDAEVALRTVDSTAMLSSDDLCCGNVGLVEVLLVASEQLRRPELRDAALRRAAATLERARQRGSFALDALPTSVWRPGLFTGVAGIGYELLRLAEPKRLPSVLLWEPPLQ